MGLSSSGRNVEAALASIPDMAIGGDTIYQNAITGINHYVNPYKNRIEIKSAQNWICPVGITQVGVFLVGGGAGGGYNSNVYAGSGGFVIFNPKVSVIPGNSYSVIIGAGGASGTSNDIYGSPGGNTSVFGLIAKGALAPNGTNGYWYLCETMGGSGGGSCASNTSYFGFVGGSNGSNGGGGGTKLQGSHISTIDPFSGVIYAGGGGGYGPKGGADGGAGGGGNSNSNGKVNTGGGGGYRGNGGSGIVVIYY